MCFYHEYNFPISSNLFQTWQFYSLAQVTPVSTWIILDIFLACLMGIAPFVTLYSAYLYDKQFPLGIFILVI